MCWKIQIQVTLLVGTEVEQAILLDQDDRCAARFGTSKLEQTPHHNPSISLQSPFGSHKSA